MRALAHRVAAGRAVLAPGGVQRIRDEAERVFRRRARGDLTEFRDQRGRLSPRTIDIYVGMYAALALDPQRREFLDKASTVLADSWTKRLQQLPAEVGERAYELALMTIIRRAESGVPRFADERGALCPDRIRAYVKFVIDKKVKQAWVERPPDPVPMAYEPAALGTDFDDWWANENPSDWIDAAQPGDDGDLLQRARRELERIRRLSLAREARRMRVIEQGLIECGIASQARAVVLARAARRWVIDVTENGTERRALPPASWRAICAEVGISTPNHAAQIHSRTMKRLPEQLRRWVQEPDSFEEASGGRRDGR